MFDKLSKINVSELKKWNISPNEIAYLKNKILNDKLGLVLNFEEKDENLENYYFGLEEVKELHINPKEKNNHLLIEGDNYYALKALQISGIKVDVIYIDPPYNTGNKDFIYNDNYVNKDDQFKHSKWLSFMKKRLELAKELLADDGVIFVSIDDNEQAYLKVLMDEIFGEQNFVSDIIWIRNPGGQSDNSHIAKTKEYILIYAKNIDLFNIKDLVEEKKLLDYKFDKNLNQYWKKGTMIEKGGSNDRLIDRKKLGYVVYYNPKLNEIKTQHDYGIDLINHNLTSNVEIYSFDQNLIKKDFIPIIPRVIKNTYGCWRMGSEKLKDLFEKNRLFFEKDKQNNWRIYEKEIFEIENPYKNLKPKDLISFTSNTKGTNQLKTIFPNDNKLVSNFHPKPSDLILYLINFHTNPNSLVLDFFAGSGTTAQAVMELNEEDGGNRRFILCTNNENDIAQKICRERIYRVINDEGSKKEEIDWNFSKDKKSLINNSMKYLKVKSIDKVNGDYEEINNLKEIYKNEFNKDLSIKDFK